MKNKKRNKKYSNLLIFVFVVFFTYLGYTLITQQISINDKKSQLKAINQQITEAEAEKEELEKQKQLVNTPEYIEKVAREELGYAAPDEIVFVDSTSQK